MKRYFDSWTRSAQAKASAIGFGLDEPTCVSATPAVGLRVAANARAAAKLSSQFSALDRFPKCVSRSNAGASNDAFTRKGFHFSSNRAAHSTPNLTVWR